MLLALFVLLLSADACLAQAPKKKNTARPATAVTLGGCIDQAPNGNFILINNTELKKVVTLHGDGFADEGFAKYLGHEVKVTGRVDKESAEPVMRVRSVDRLSETCTPRK
jgi:hypothetical protein